MRGIGGRPQLQPNGAYPDRNYIFYNSSLFRAEWLSSIGQ